MAGAHFATDFEDGEDVNTELDDTLGNVVDASVNEGFDPFVSPSDPYPYEPAAPSSAHRAREAEPQRKANPYAAASKKVNNGRRRVHIARILVITALVLILTAIGVAVVYISNLNARLTENVTEELRDQLAVTEAGDPFYLLLLGIDKDQSRVEDTENYGAEDSAYRSDSIMLCCIDPKNVKVTMVSIHRDTYVDMGENGKNKINASYSFGGPAYATEVVSEFCDVPISHYAEVDLDRFISIVDVIGGVTVNLPVPVHDPEYTGLDLPAGEQTLNGEEAALLCRCRHGYDEYGDGDRYRAANQRMVFSEVIKKVLASDPATMMSTISTMAESVTTDMSIAEILDLANQMKSLNVETDIMTGMEPTEGKYVNETWYEVCNVPEWRKMMMRVYQGLSPYDVEQGEYDSTAGVAGGVGEEGDREVEAALLADAEEAEVDAPTDDQQDTSYQEPAEIVY